MEFRWYSSFQNIIWWTGLHSCQGEHASSIITFPQHNQDVAENTTFKIAVTVSGMELGRFTNAESTYYSAPTFLNSAGQIIGQSEEARKVIACNPFRRVLRIGVPATLATILPWALCQLGIFELATGDVEYLMRVYTWEEPHLLKEIYEYYLYLFLRC